MMYAVFEEFGTHWNKFLKMGARFGVTTNLYSNEYESLEKTQHVASVSASVSIDAIGSQCPGTSCSQNSAKSEVSGAIEKAHALGKIIAKQKAADVKKGDTTDYGSYLLTSNGMFDVGGKSIFHEDDLERRRRREELDGKLLKLGADAVAATYKTANDNFARGRRAVSVHVQTAASKLAVQQANEKGAQLEREYLQSLERSSEISGSASMDVSSTAKSRLSSNSESQSIISIGKGPDKDIMAWARSTTDENMPIFSYKEPICKIIELALDRLYGFEPTAEEYKANPKRSGEVKLTERADANQTMESFLESGLDLTKIPALTISQRDQIVQNCFSALEENGTVYASYCEWYKYNYLSTLTCSKPITYATNDSAHVVAQCYEDTDCKSIKADDPGTGSKTIPRKCVNNKCVLSYKRIDDFAINTEESEAANQCPPMYKTVTIEGRDDGQIREGCSGAYTKLCFHESDDPKHPGVCDVKLVHGSCPPEYSLITTSGISDGDINQYGGFAIKLCQKKTGCEVVTGTGDEMTVKPAMVALTGTTADDWQCGHAPSGISATMVRVSKDSDLKGDLNEDKWCDSVYLCQDEASTVNGN